MEIFRAKNPDILVYISDKAKEIEGIDDEVILRDMVVQLARDPEGTYISVCFEGNELMAFCFATVEEQDDHTWILYAWSDPSLEKMYKDEVGARVEDWTIEGGRHKMKMKTTRRNAAAWQKLYGFVEEALILRKDI